MSDVMKFLDYDGLSTFKSQMDILLADKQDVGDCVLKTGDTMSGALTIGSRASGSTVGETSLAVGSSITASGDHTLACGGYAAATANDAVALGNRVKAGGVGSLARGSSAIENGIEASGEGTMAMGAINNSSADNKIKAGNYGAMALGGVQPNSGSTGIIQTVSQAAFAFGKVEGAGGTIEAGGAGSFAGGLVAGGATLKTSAGGAIAYGLAVQSNQQAMAVFGKYNKVGASGDIFIIGKGTGDAAANRANAFRVTTGGVVYSTGAYNTSGADYAEITEWQDGNPNAEDRVGKFVCMQGNKMRFANSQDVRSRIGVVSANPAINGDSFSEEWQGKYKTDVFGRVENRIVHHPSELDSEGNIVPGYDEVVYTISENYDPTQEYIPREKRKEYDNFGMLGKLIVIDDGTCQVDGYCYPNDNAIATSEQDANKGFYVMERLDATHIKILLK